ncbi:MAG: MerR family transcriptional regulator [Bacteroides sp.]|nr:MerR family transcriptional regulator [Bacteroides sp.]
MQENTDKLYYKISEVAEMVNVPQSTLRYWETQFPSIRAGRSGGGTRRYTPADIENIRMIKFLVHDRGLKMEAAQAELKLNRDGVAKKADAIRRLKEVREQLQHLIDSLHSRR